jgi:hypothetical protein
MFFEDFGLFTQLKKEEDQAKVDMLLADRDNTYKKIRDTERGLALFDRYNKDLLDAENADIWFQRRLIKGSIRKLEEHLDDVVATIIDRTAPVSAFSFGLRSERA